MLQFPVDSISPDDFARLYGHKDGKNKVELLQEALERSMIVATNARTQDDGGACNFDSPVLMYRDMHMKKSDAIKAINSAGLRCFEWKLCGRIMGLVISGCTCGQGNCHTVMAEAFSKNMEKEGYPSTMYYQMD